MSKNHKFILQIKNLTKLFEFKKIFVDFSYNFELGRYAILGPNGIGKSTLLEMIAGIQTPDTGNIVVNGIDLIANSTKAKQYMAFVPDKLNFYPYITGQEFLHFIMRVRSVKGSDIITRMIDLFRLEPYLLTALGDMSLGTQKKFALVAALISEAQLLIMDEPTTALDRSSRQALIEYLLTEKHERMILFSSHDQELIDGLDARKLKLLHHPNQNFIID